MTSATPLETFLTVTPARLTGSAASGLHPALKGSVVHTSGAVKDGLTVAADFNRQGSAEKNLRGLWAQAFANQSAIETESASETGSDALVASQERLAVAGLDAEHIGNPASELNSDTSPVSEVQSIFKTGQGTASKYTTGKSAPRNISLDNTSFYRSAIAILERPGTLAISAGAGNTGTSKANDTSKQHKQSRVSGESVSAAGASGEVQVSAADLAGRLGAHGAVQAADATASNTCDTTTALRASLLPSPALISVPRQTQARSVELASASHSEQREPIGNAAGIDKPGINTAATLLNGVSGVSSKVIDSQSLLSSRLVDGVAEINITEPKPQKFGLPDTQVSFASRSLASPGEDLSDALRIERRVEAGTVTLHQKSEPDSQGLFQETFQPLSETVKLNTARVTATSVGVTAIPSGHAMAQILSEADPIKIASMPTALPQTVTYREMAGVRFSETEVSTQRMGVGRGSSPAMSPGTAKTALEDSEKGKAVGFLDAQSSMIATTVSGAVPIEEVRSASPGVLALSSHEGGSVSLSPFQAIDAADSRSQVQSGTVSGRVAGHSLAVGYQDPALGYIELQAHGAGGVVHAALVADSSSSGAALASHLGTLAEWMHEHHTSVESLTVVAHERGRGSSAGSGTGLQYGSGAESDKSNSQSESAAGSFSGHANAQRGGQRSKAAESQESLRNAPGQSDLAVIHSVERSRAVRGNGISVMA